DQTSNNWTIRQPVDDTYPEGVVFTVPDVETPDANWRRLPAGNFRNFPDAENTRFYPDRDATPRTVFDPGFRGQPAKTTTHYPFVYDPNNPGSAGEVNGDPIPENITAYLDRWSRYAIEVIGFDGFRIDAQKHTFPFFWDGFFDAAIHDARIAPNGERVVPYTFGENTTSNFDILNTYIRLDGVNDFSGFAKRDSLDLSGSGTLRNIIGARGTGNISSFLGSHLDNENDGFNDGDLGVNHTHSHDNGTRDTRNDQDGPDFPFDDKIGFWAQAYIFMRPGPAIAYHNSRESLARFQGQGRFWPDEGLPTAIGLGQMYTVASPGTPVLFENDQRIPNAVRARAKFGRGDFIPLWQDGNVFVFDRRTSGSQSNALVGMNDSYNQGFDQRTVQTAFPQGTVLVEYSGSATDPVVDPNNDIFDTVTVGANGLVTIRIPRNVSINGDEHQQGYVIYAPQVPPVTTDVTNVAVTLGPESSTIPTFRRRLTPIDVITAPTFEISGITSRSIPENGDTLCLNCCDSAIFRFNEGYTDLNNNGVVDRDFIGMFGGYEDFLTQNVSLAGTTNTNGIYRQIIDAAALPEGYNYLSMIFFRARPSGTEPIYEEVRRVIYNDQRAPDVALDASRSCTNGAISLNMRFEDGTATEVHAFVGLEAGDPTPALNIFNEAIQTDRRSFRFTIQPDAMNPNGLPDGTYNLRIVVLEKPGNGYTGTHEIETTFTIGEDRGDLDNDGDFTVEDLYLFENFTGDVCDVDFDADQMITDFDRSAIKGKVRADEADDISG
ncbi:MAG: hypothetical protein AAGD00_10505, partial [Planctomycetota bacterium]